jgi:hypothetical protein
LTSFFFIAASSISSWWTRRLPVQLEGEESISIRSRGASSIRSIALSGSWRSAMYRSESTAAADSAVADRNAVVRLVALLQAAQDRDRVRGRRLADQTGWNRRSRAASFSMCRRYSSRVVAPIQRSSPREHRLEHVRGVDRALCRTGTDDRVQLVDEQDDLAYSRLISVSTAFSRSSNSPRYFEPMSRDLDVQRPDPLALQSFGDIVYDDAARALDDRRLTDARIADQHRVVLCGGRAPGSRGDLVAADHRVELAILGERGQSRPNFSSARYVPSILRGHPPAASHLLDLREQLVARDRVEPEQEVLGRDVVASIAPRPQRDRDFRQRGRHRRLPLATLDPRLRRDSSAEERSSSAESTSARGRS